MGAVTGDGKSFPFRNVDVGNVLESAWVKIWQKPGKNKQGKDTCLVVLHVLCNASDFGQFTHCLDSEDAFESEISLELEGTGEVIGGDYLSYFVIWFFGRLNTCVDEMARGRIRSDTLSIASIAHSFS